MKLKILFFAFFVLVFSDPGFSGEMKKISAVGSESSLTYRLVHPMHKIEATNKDFLCEVLVDQGTNQITRLQVEADVTTFDSGNSNRDSHAMEVIDAIDYPEVSFVSSSILPVENKFEIKGTLTFHGCKKEIALMVSPRISGTKTIVEGNFNLSLTEFKIDRPSLLLIPVDDTLSISFVITFPAIFSDQHL